MNTTIIISSIIIALILTFVPEIKGWLGEKKVARKLSKLPLDDYRVINDVMVKTDKSDRSYSCIRIWSICY